jgi:hypothetical protein
MRQYKLIGNSFNLGGRLRLDYHGPIIASPDAFFLVIGARPGQVLASNFGAVGLLAYKSIGSFLKAQHDVLEFKYEDLPSEVTGHPDWPIKGGPEHVIVVPRNVIDRIRYSFFATYDLVCGERSYCIALNLLTRRSTMAALREMGWNEKLDAGGSLPVMQQLAPFWGLAVGAVIGAGIKLAMGAPLLAGRGAAIEFAAIGAGAGLVAGTAFYLWAQRKAMRGEN